MQQEDSSLGKLLNWFEHYSKHSDLDRLWPNANIFWKVKQVQIEKFESQTGVSIPPFYRDFLLRVGEGHFALGNNGLFEDTYKNYFLGPEEIAGILLKESESWLVYDEFIRAGEFPFFDIGSHSVLVFKDHETSQGRVFFGGLDEPPIAESFVSFLEQLRANPRFYIKSES